MFITLETGVSGNPATGRDSKILNSFLFMALEGFINIISHRFVKADINDLDMERGLNIEQKIRLMPYLCEGFNNDFNEAISETYEDFVKLKKYRNELFHAKVEDSLFTAVKTGIIKIKMKYSAI